MKNAIALAALALATVPLAAFAQDGGAPYAVAKWKDGKACAISYTFDDGLRDHFTHVLPLLKRHGLRGTFWIIGDAVETGSLKRTPVMDWPQIAEIARWGNEIASHGLHHKATSRCADHAEILAERDLNADLIEKRTGLRPVTFCYPFNDKKDKDGESIVALVEDGLVGSRTFQKAFGGKTKADDFNAYIEREREKGAWVVTMTHGIVRGYDMWENPKELDKHFRWVREQKDIWIAPFRDVCAYAKVRDCVELTFTQDADGNTVATPSTGALDGRIFGGTMLTLLDSEGGKVCDFDPFQGSFTVKR
ncbi:MAG: polysaccharide deacetylase family protein [Kiritimatiellae bacterium]|nr:polysaccharide deacetylase family protein [Kiritimatiellia bacterium]